MNFFTNIVKKYIKNDPSNIMDPNSQEDVLGKKSSDFGPKIKEDIETPDKENICNKTQDISAYDSQGDNFYNTIEVENNNTRSSAESPLSTYSEDDLINFDQSISVGQRYSIGRYSTQLNETFDIRSIPVTTKHLKVKTSDLLSIPGIGGRYSTSSSYNDSIIIEDEENEVFYAADGVRTEENSGEFLPATTALDQISCTTKGENQNILKCPVLDTKEGEKIKHFSLNETTSNESDNLNLDGNNISSVLEGTAENSPNFTDNEDTTITNFEIVSDKSVESGTVETKRSGENLNITTETAPESSVESGTAETNRSRENLNVTSVTENEISVNIETLPEKSLDNGSVNINKSKENLNFTFETVSETFVESGTTQNNRSRENLNLTSATENEISVNIETLPEKSLDSGTVKINKSKENLNSTFEIVSETFVESGIVETIRSNENLDLTSDITSENSIESGTVDTNRSIENTLTNETVLEKSLKSETVEINRSRETTPDKTKEKITVEVKFNEIEEKPLTKSYSDSKESSVSDEKINILFNNIDQHNFTRENNNNNKDSFSEQEVNTTITNTEKQNLTEKKSNVEREGKLSPIQLIDNCNNSNFKDNDIRLENIEFELSPKSPTNVKLEHLFPKPSVEKKLEYKSLVDEKLLDPSKEENTGRVDLGKTCSLEDIDCNLKMTDIMEKLNQQQAEISDLKLKLNAAQQHNATLELQIRQNEEIVIKTQAEALRTEQNYQQEVKQLKEKLNESSKIIEKDRIRELEEQVKDGKTREAKLLAEISQRTKDDVNYEKIVDQCELNLKARIAELKKLEEENKTTRNHLTNLELAFSDVHSKYEKTKASLEGVRANEETLLTDLELAQSTNIQHEERYESLKAHARTQIEKSNKEIHTMKEQHEVEINKLKAFIKRLEIKVSSLEVSLQQKTEECEQLSALCDEVTGKRV